MGCDIHAYPERRQDDGVWVPLGKMPRRAFDAMHSKHVGGTLDDDFYDQWYNEYDWDWSIGRNYGFFAQLADVRNYPDRGTIVPLYADRGVPVDVSDVIGAIVTEYDAYGHSHTWATLRELLHEGLANHGNPGWPQWVQALSESNNHDLDGTRVVFFFDN